MASSLLLDIMNSSLLLLPLRLVVVLFWLVQPVGAFMPIVGYDIYLETLAVGLSLSVLQSLTTASIGRRPPLLVRVIKRNTILSTQSRHVVTTTRDNQTEIVMSLWAGMSNSDQPYRYIRAGDVLLGFVRQRVPAAPQTTIQVHVTITVTWEWCGPWDRGGGPPPVERHRLVVATAIAMDDSDNNYSQGSRLPPPPEILRGLVLEQYINTDHFAPSLVVPYDRPVSCFPLGSGWDLDDLEYHRSLAAAADADAADDDNDGFVDPVYPRYREMFQMIRDDALNINEDEDSEEEKEDVLLLLPASTAASSSADQEQHAMGSDDDDQAVSCTDDRPGGLIEPDDWLYRDETIIRSINACFHVMEVPTRERPHTIQKCRVTKMWRPWKF
jgi:hypothetical protein